MAVNIRRSVLLALMLCAIATQGAQNTARGVGEQLSASDREAIKATIEKYRISWLKNDKDGVLGVFSDDAALLPSHGASAVEGKSNVERYWFAPGPPTVITKLDITITKIEGSRFLAFVYGRDDVGWTATERGAQHHHFHPGTYLNVMKRDAKGDWKIQVHMWDDGTEKVE